MTRPTPIGAGALQASEPAQPEGRAGAEHRYDAFAVLLHWAMAAALIAQIAFGFLLDEIAPRGTPDRGTVINLHKSIGIVLGLLVLVRIVWRLRHPPPAWPRWMARHHARAASLGHAALYACMLVVPASGYLGSNLSRHGVRFFGLAWDPWGPDLPVVYETLGTVHAVTAWIFTALIVGHVGAALLNRRVSDAPLRSRMGLAGRPRAASPRLAGD